MEGLSREVKKPYVITIIGDAGVGKTYFFTRTLDQENIYQPATGDGSGASMWWDHYHDDECKLLDDFTGWMSRTFWLQFVRSMSSTCGSKKEF